MMREQSLGRDVCTPDISKLKDQLQVLRCGLRRDVCYLVKNLIFGLTSSSASRERYGRSQFKILNENHSMVNTFKGDIQYPVAPPTLVVEMPPLLAIDPKPFRLERRTQN